MKRETVNSIRFILEDVMPPVMRDSVFGRWLFRLYLGDRIDEMANFRKKAPHISEEEYAAVYNDYERIMDETDNSEGCIEAISESLIGNNICDVGCGTGYLVRRLKRENGKDRTYCGCDLIIDDETRESDPAITWTRAPIESLPFADNAFDTVICTHVLEHVLDIQAAIRELRRIAKKRLVVVVPREREYIYTFNPHLHFFPYAHSFLRVMKPPQSKFICKLIGRDIFYVEDVDDDYPPQDTSLSFCRSKT